MLIMCKLHLVQYGSFLSRFIKTNAKENIFKEPLPHAATGPSGPGLPIVESSLLHTHTHKYIHIKSDTPHSEGLLWAGDQPDAETST